MTKQEALEILAKYEYERLKATDVYITDEHPSGVYIPSNDKDCWFCRIPSEQPKIGSQRVVAISKKTGKVVFDGYCGE